jgi:outer membrane lipoprotein-sorting protein
LKQLIPALALAAAAPLAFGPLSAQAAPPTAFTATGTALMHANGKTPETRTPIKIFYQQGQMRLEMKTPGNGDSVVLAQKGKTTLTLMDLQQKVAFTVNPEIMAGQDSQLPLQQLSDLTSWKGLLTKQGKRLAGKEVKAGQSCSIWETTQGQTKTKVWFADALELPMQLQSSVAGKPGFTFTVQSITPNGKVNANLFKVPADFTQADLQN